MGEIVPGVHLVDGTNANSYISIDDDGIMTVVDGTISPKPTPIINYIERELKTDVKGVKLLVITHCHVDHTRGVRWLKELTGANIAIHGDDADYLSGIKAYPYPRGAMGLLFRLSSPFMRSRPVKPDLKLSDGDLVGQLKVIHLPGHTPGSIALHDEKRKVLFVGDALRYNGKELRESPGMFSYDPNLSKTSLKKLIGVDFRVLLPGHGQPMVSSDAPAIVKEFIQGLNIDTNSR
ncbi:MAG: MBL fold metallo-hydrolase [Nitrososphaerota archaeon]|jgi:glyoxylase-like metal-dependent hydrolase (beta-lactamase superfamily II)|nr:MBL fold metallo-hydrolase [Nitrososphaerota archaeon]MDG7036186.1 MBL fold metallo-hydrolase [Nitrososphaerota archaeon]MDG7039623.1 MBL fold metallo-hydrolase [Nitrososphaerota archaeon]MDG7040219.1 MBL fold metallo-hydrolase [Nitrososphaerota archaeon]MDG7041670.1 MBL fold metallo-hydrolase [Nitrososphaerota archaeon]